MEQSRLQSGPYPADHRQSSRSVAGGELAALQTAWRGVLEYWLECGIEFRSGDRLEFVTPPSRGRGNQSAVVEVVAQPAAPSPLPTRPPFFRPVEREPVVAAPVVTAAPLLDAGLRDASFPAPLPVAERPARLASLAAEVAGCTQCGLAKTRTHTVFGVGSPESSVVFVGEGPGAEEDLRGEPFVGAAGKLLDHMLRAIALDRSQVFIANVVKCRPPGNRNPQLPEVAACQGYLFQQLEIIRPRTIFCLGKFALLCLTGHDDTVGRARGKPFFWRGIPVIASYHPAYYLRTPGRKRAAWEDLLRLSQQLEQMQ
ncbi:MAG: uracil-DNA glycosylase [Magnetococcales bacterium]|nr:uracil-DNA glycosylase [Magnetococcales bacterium]